MRSETIILASALFFLLLASVNSRGMWGSRRKAIDEESNDDAEDVSGFESLQRRAVNSRRAKTVVGFDGAGAALSGEANIGSTIASFIDMYINMMEEVVNSPDFESSVTPEMIKSIISKVPALTSNPELAQMLDSPQFNDPTLLKQTITDGLSTIRAYSSQIVDTFSDPEKLSALLSQIPEELRTVVDGLMNGDTSAVKDLIANIPGLEPAQKRMMLDMLDGNTGSIADNVKKVLGDPSQIEAARQQFLTNPSMAEMFGITEDILRDKKKFAALMADGMDALAAGGGKDQDSEDDSNRLFKGASMSG
jgi:hypothetical protein